MKNYLKNLATFIKDSKFDFYFWLTSFLILIFVTGFKIQSWPIYISFLGMVILQSPPIAMWQNARKEQTRKFFLIAYLVLILLASISFFI